jgi:hypothetical protein
MQLQRQIYFEILNFQGGGCAESKLVKSQAGKRRVMFKTGGLVESSVQRSSRCGMMPSHLRMRNCRVGCSSFFDISTDHDGWKIAGRRWF